MSISDIEGFNDAAELKRREPSLSSFATFQLKIQMN